jgi:hypothetical protein
MLDGTGGGYELGTDGGGGWYECVVEDGRDGVEASVVTGAGGWLFEAGWIAEGPCCCLKIGS